MTLPEGKIPQQPPDSERAVETTARFSLLARERGPGGVDAIRRQLHPDEELIYGGLARLRTRGRSLSGIIGGRVGIGRVGIVAITSHRLLWCSPSGEPQQLAGAALDAPSETSCDEDAQGRADDSTQADASSAPEWSLHDMESGELDALLSDWHRAHGGLLHLVDRATGDSDHAESPNADQNHAAAALMHDTAVTACHMHPIGYVTLTDGLTLPARINQGEASAGEVVRVERHRGEVLLASRATAGRQNPR